MPAAHVGTFILGQPLRIHAFQQQFAGVGLVEQAEEIDQRGLAAARGAFECYEIGLDDIDIDTAQCVYGLGT